MDSDSEDISLYDRPDLEEFLSALDGFLDKKSLAENPGLLRFLEVFCRSIGANEGHFLRPAEQGGLQSLVSFGMKDTFNDEFNKAQAAGANEPSLMEETFRRREVVAVTDLQKMPNVPSWFRQLMNQNNFMSLVAVPLLGQARPVGIFCAYYHDVCLFDQHSLDHMMMIGRMVGAAIERSSGAGQPESQERREKALDRFLETVTDEGGPPVRVFQLLAEAVSESLQLKGALCGPLRINDNMLVLTVAAGKNIPESAVSKRFVVPPLVAKRMTGENPGEEALPVGKEDMGELRDIIQETPIRPVACPIFKEKKLSGAVVGWRDPATPLQKEEGIFLSRLCRIASLALHLD